MNSEEYLNEERYQRNKKKITIVITIIMIIGLLLGGGLIAFSIYRNNTSEKETNLTKEKLKLENKKNELETKGIKYDAFTTYTDGEAYELKVIIRALDPSFDYCLFDECKNNDITKNYCLLKNKIVDIKDGFENRSLIIFGAFIIIVTIMISTSMYISLVKGRNVMAYALQQNLPLVKETIEKVSPSINKHSKPTPEEMKDIFKSKISFFYIL